MRSAQARQGPCRRRQARAGRAAAGQAALRPGRSQGGCLASAAAGWVVLASNGIVFAFMCGVRPLSYVLARQLEWKAAGEASS